MNQTVIERALQFGNLSAHSTLQRRHTTFISHTELEACHRGVRAEQDADFACYFVQSTVSCHSLVNIVDYLEYMVCHLDILPNTTGSILMSLITVGIIFMYALFLYVVSAYFILPNVLHVAKYVHVSMYDYGLTTIALILTAPEVMWVMQKCQRYSQNGTMILAHMLGKSFSTYTVGLAVICFRGQTKLPAKFLLHTFIALVAFISSVVLLHWKFLIERQPIRDQYPINMRAVAYCFTLVYVSSIAYEILSKRRFGRSVNMRSRPMSHMYFSDISDEEPTGWSQFWNALNPFAHLRAPKWVVALLTPLWILAALQIPVIDKRRPMYGWCKYLTCINLMIFPWQTYFLKNTHSLAFTGSVMFIAFVFTVITIFQTRADQPPKHQGFYAIAGIIFGLSSYHIIGVELETMLWQMSSYIYNMRADIIMLTGFVLNYLLNVGIFSYETVKEGYGNLACGVVVGIVLNQAFLVLPIVVHQYCSKIQNLVTVSANSVTCLIFMLFVFMSMIFSLSATDYKLRLSHGIYLLILYAVFILYLGLSYMEVMHPYGAYHSIASDLRKTILSDWA